jgi:hypothetical protein
MQQGFVYKSLYSQPITEPYFTSYGHPRKTVRCKGGGTSIGMVCHPATQPLAPPLAAPNPNRREANPYTTSYPEMESHKKAFHKKTRRGKVVRLVQERYLRTDQGCGFFLSSDAKSGDGNRLSVSNIQDIVSKSPHKHLLILDTNICVHQKPRYLLFTVKVHFEHHPNLY